MKKPALLVFAFLLFALISVYFIVPQIITTTSIVKIDASDVTVAKFLLDKKQWAKWWPGRRDMADSNLFFYNGTTYNLQKSTNSDVDVLLNYDDTELESKLIYSAQEEGLCAVSWITKKQSSLNPFVRIAEYMAIKNHAEDLNKILSSFKDFMHLDTNVYGIKVSVVKVKQPFMLAANITTYKYPSAELIYSLIDKIKQQIAAQGAAVVNTPMLNVNRTDDNQYQVMVAVPTDKPAKAGINTLSNKMVLGGNMLSTQVKGGRGAIENAFKQLKIYQKDHRLISPAMPFEQFVTDRLTERDTAKWVTNIYWPIF